MENNIDKINEGVVAIIEARNEAIHNENKTGVAQII